MPDRVVLTTGANSGIGLATVIELAKRGYTSVGSARSKAKAALITKAAEDAGVSVDTVIFDVGDAAGCEAAVKEVVETHGGLYALVNNAGYALNGAVEEIGDDEARQLLETMVIAPMRLARLALPHLRAGGGGRIVNISSIYGRTTTPLTGWYQAAKHGLEGVSDALRVEVAGDGVAVVLIEPGAFKTNIWEAEAPSAGTGSRYATAYERTQNSLKYVEPLMGDPAACARVIAGAISSRSPRARYLVGNDAVLLAAVDQLTPTFLKDRITRLTLGL